MVNDFNGFDKGVIGKKLPSDSTLNNMKKADLIKLLHIAEHNHSTLAWFYKNACDNSKCNRCPLEMNYNKAIDDVMAKAKEIQEEQIKNLENSTMRNGKRWAIYMNTYLGHIQVACKRLIAEQLKESGVNGMS